MKHLIFFIVLFLGCTTNENYVPSDNYLGLGTEKLTYSNNGTLENYSYQGYEAKISHIENLGDTIKVFMIYSIWCEEDFVIRIQKRGELIKEWKFEKNKNLTGIISFSIFNTETDGLYFEVQMNGESPAFYSEPFSIDEKVDEYYEEEPVDPLELKTT